MQGSSDPGMLVQRKLGGGERNLHDVKAGGKGDWRCGNRVTCVTVLSESAVSPKSSKSIDMYSLVALRFHRNQLASLLF